MFLRTHWGFPCCFLPGQLLKSSGWSNIYNSSQTAKRHQSEKSVRIFMMSDIADFVFVFQILDVCHQPLFQSPLSSHMAQVLITILIS